MAARPDVRSSAPVERSLAGKLNWLRAAVLGANDGIVSTAGLVFGVAGATSDSMALLIAGMAGVVAGALSMAGGEFVSVSSQRDTEIAALAHTTSALAEDPDGQLRRLAAYYAARGITEELALRSLRISPTTTPSKHTRVPSWALIPVSGPARSRQPWPRWRLSRSVH